MNINNNVVLNAAPLPSYRSDLKEVQSKLRLTIDEIRSLIEIDRKIEQEHQVFQKTLGLVKVVKNESAYIFSDGKFRKTDKNDILDLEFKASSVGNIEPPSFISLKAVWDETLEEGAVNLFGGTVSLYLDTNHISIPKVKATADGLAYYGAVMVPEEIPVKFPGSQFPLFMMEVGEQWFKKGVQSPSFGGVFLEYHHDQPHYHMAYEEGSVYFLAKWSDESKTDLQITAFELPVGVGIYTKKGAIHSDVALRGKAVVGYMLSNDFSVAFLKNNQVDKAPVAVSIQNNLK